MLHVPPIPSGQGPKSSIGTFSAFLEVRSVMSGLSLSLLDVADMAEVDNGLE